MIAARLVVLAAVLTSACGRPLMKLPAGQGPPAAGTAAALAEATSACRPLTSITAEISVSGSIGGGRMRGRLLAGLAAPDRARLEAPAPFGQPVFIFAAQGAQATLLLPRDQRVLEHGRAEAVLEAVAGVSMTPAQLRATLTGCAADPLASEGMSVGDGWIMIPGDQRTYLKRSRPTDRWRLVAAVQRDGAGVEWRSEYANFVNDLPRSIRLASSDGRRFHLRLMLSQVETNVPLGEEAFRVRIPPGWEPITIEELRRAGPLAQIPSESDGR